VTLSSQAPNLGSSRYPYPANVPYAKSALLGVSPRAHERVPECRAPDLARMQATNPPTNAWWMQVGCALQDIILLCLNLCGALYLFLGFRTMKMQGTGTSIVPYRHVCADLVLFAVFLILLLKAANLYSVPQFRSPLHECGTIALAILVSLFLLSLIKLVAASEVFSKGATSFVVVLSFVTLSGWRVLRRKVILLRMGQRPPFRNVLIVGAGRIGKRLARVLEQHRNLGYHVQGFVDRDKRCDAHLLGTIENLPQVARAHFVDEVIITNSNDRELVQEVTATARHNRLDVKLVLDLHDDPADPEHVATEFEQIGGYPALVLHRQPAAPAFELLLKRTFDIVVSGLSLLLLLPVMVAIAIAIRLDSPGQVVYAASRLGKKGRLFRCFKFRTMINGADGLKKELRGTNEREGPFFKLAEDPRVTKLGKWLRKYSVDELPQLWNVLRGDMSLVGPRPHPVDDCQYYRLDHLRRLDVTPGITGLWQITSRRDPSFERNMSLDLQYIEDWSLWQDLRILLKTIPAVLRAEGQ